VDEAAQRARPATRIIENGREGPTARPSDGKESSMSAQASPDPPKKPGCLRRFLGCLGTGFVLMVGAIVLLAVLPGWHAKSIRNSIKPGMSVSEVVTLGRGWLFCVAHAGPLERRTKDIALFHLGFTVRPADTRRTFATTEEMARALTDEMATETAGWTMTFGYITMSPNRIYFDVEFSPDGRVKTISPTRWGTLN
jgi:hypothetical protein